MSEERTASRLILDEIYRRNFVEATFEASFRASLAIIESRQSIKTKEKPMATEIFRRNALLQRTLKNIDAVLGQIGHLEHKGNGEKYVPGQGAALEIEPTLRTAIANLRRSRQEVEAELHGQPPASSVDE